MQIRITMALFFLFLSVQPCLARHINTEKFYQSKWCLDNKGKMDIRVPDGSRCDCVTEEYAVEFNYSEKWAELIGQSLNMALQTGKKAGIGLIIENQQDYTNWVKLNRIIMHYKLPIRTWDVHP